MSATAEPTPLPEGKGESDKRHADTSPARDGFVSPFPSVEGGAGGWRIGLALAALVCVAGAVWYFAVRTPEPRDDFERFQGTWLLAGPGNRLPVTVRVTGDRWAFLTGEQEQKKYRLELRPDADPKEIDLTQLGPDDRPTAFVLKGIYSFEDGRAKVVSAPGALPRPTSFDASDSPVWVLERP